MQMATQAQTPVLERELLAAAREGDEQAFSKLVEPRRGELHAHCYRMLGSVQDAEDALQEAMLRAWKGLSRFEGRSSLRSWLYTISTNTCLNAIERRPKRVLPIDYGPAADPGVRAPKPSEPGAPIVESVWIEPYADEHMQIADGLAGPEATIEQRESVELAFVAALQHLPANQRAVLILRSVLGFSAQEVADALDTSVASVNSALQRARKTVDEKLPDESQQEALRNLDDAELRELVENYSAALEEGDIDQILALLTEDATWSMPPLVNWYRGKEAVRGFLELGPAPLRWRHIPTRANGQAAVGCYMWDEDAGKYLSFCIDVLTLRGGKIAAVTAFIDRDVFPRFGLPDEYPA
jgi:RNA polymerase sigma-70 factor (ECF subfamily)